MASIFGKESDSAAEGNQLVATKRDESLSRSLFTFRSHFVTIHHDYYYVFMTGDVPRPIKAHTLCKVAGLCGSWPGGLLNTWRQRRTYPRSPSRASVRIVDNSVGITIIRSARRPGDRTEKRVARAGSKRPSQRRERRGQRHRTSAGRSPKHPGVGLLESESSPSSPALQ